MAPKVMLFVGAPPPSIVNASSCTLDRLQPVFKQFVRHGAVRSSVGGEGDEDEHRRDPHPHAVWLSLPLIHQPLRMSGFSQLHQLNDTVADQSRDFFTTIHASDLANADGGEDLLSQFYEHSLAHHNPAVPSSQLDGDQSSAAADTSIATATWSSSAGSSAVAAGTPQPIPCHLSDLEDVPPARHVLSLRPQTVTVNLIVAIISVAQPRTVTTRWGSTLSLVEIVVGDDTKSGFGVTCWLSSDSILESQLARLHRQDTVLLRNVSLNVFRDRVYGQSLRRGLTQITLLWSADGSGYYSTRDLTRKTREPGAHPQVVKTKKVRDWALEFVGSDRKTSTKRAPRKSWDQPPDHTQ
ncbi:hypothetical protein GMORB2_0807 [Geosmithia morbida]|uniref:Uncharacterized protein n=1 Tax=Geosmithia morbida TaxID=1094350 RepID=A0A9P4Z1I0_9HYPO|nr:uncharacterized protein GMORB2_0807 [Geosmithia morbida]KAF4125563.1 hypothetical protein GMORB2_0807 [Geosmithia morbida]